MINDNPSGQEYCPWKYNTQHLLLPASFLNTMHVLPLRTFLKIDESILKMSASDIKSRQFLLE